MSSGVRPSTGSRLSMGSAVSAGRYEGSQRGSVIIAGSERGSMGSITRPSNHGTVRSNATGATDGTGRSSRRFSVSGFEVTCTLSLWDMETLGAFEALGDRLRLDLSECLGLRPDQVEYDAYEGEAGGVGIEVRLKGFTDAGEASRVANDLESAANEGDLLDLNDFGECGVSDLVVLGPPPSEDAARGSADIANEDAQESRDSVLQGRRSSREDDEFTVDDDPYTEDEKSISSMQSSDSVQDHMALAPRLSGSNRLSGNRFSGPSVPAVLEEHTEDESEEWQQASTAGDSVAWQPPAHEDGHEAFDDYEENYGDEEDFPDLARNRSVSSNDASSSSGSYKRKSGLLAGIASGATRSIFGSKKRPGSGSK